MEREDEESKIKIECPMSYTLLDKNGNQVETGDSKGTITKEYLTIYPKFGNVLPFHLREISRIETENYQITLPTFSNETLILSNLGYSYEDFSRVLRNLRNEVIIRDLLMNETVRKPEADMEFTLNDERGRQEQKDEGKIRLYETGFVVIPQKGEIIRVPYSDITSVSEEDYSLKVNTELGEQFFFQKLGSEFGSLLKEFSGIYSELQTKAVSSVKTLYPAIDSVSLRKVVAMLREGKAAKREDIEATSPRLWQELEKKIASMGLNESYSLLKELGRQEKTSVGFKRGLMGDLTGEYIWFLIPIYGGSDKGYGNAFAMEAAETADEETSGKATYFFKIVNRTDYPNYRIPEELDKSTDELMKKINRCMLDINFRREPIYLPTDRLEETEYVKYKIALRRIPSLQLIRNLFIGRIIHSSPEQWKNDVMELLKFNVSTQDDTLKWKRQ